MCKGRCLSNTGAKTPLIFYHLRTLEIYPYLQTNMSSTINLTLCCEHKISSTGLSYACLQVRWLCMETGACPREAE